MERQSILKVFDYIYTVVFAVFFLYAFWFQYSVVVLDGLFILFGVGFVLYVLVNFKALKPTKTKVALLFVFLLISFVGTIFFSRNQVISFNSLVSIGKYIVPSLALVCFVGKKEKNFLLICSFFFAAVLLLCLSIFLRPVAQPNGGITIGHLNSNVLSSFLLIQLYCGFALLIYLKKGVIKGLLVLALVIGFVSQYRAASRRGVFLYVLFSFFFLLYFVYLKNKKSIYPVLAFTLLSLGVGVLILFIVSGTNSVLLYRITASTQTSTGDELRSIYQEYAISLFLNSPLLGAGLNGVAAGIGVYSHNMFTELLGCTGLIGTLVFCLFLFSTCYPLTHKCRLRKGAKSDLLRTLSLLFFLVIVVSGISVVQFYDLYFYISLAFLLTVPSVLSSEESVPLCEYYTYSI